MDLMINNKIKVSTHFLFNGKYCGYIIKSIIIFVVEQYNNIVLN